MRTAPRMNAITCRARRAVGRHVHTPEHSRSFPISHRMYHRAIHETGLSSHTCSARTISATAVTPQILQNSTHLNESLEEHTCAVDVPRVWVKSLHPERRLALRLWQIDSQQVADPDRPEAVEMRRSR